MSRIPRATFNVEPRFASGSPAQVDADTAMHVAADEREFYRMALEGAFGTTKQAVAEAIGLKGIVWAWYEKQGHIFWWDIITDERGSFKVGRDGGIKWPWKEQDIPGPARLVKMFPLR